MVRASELRRHPKNWRMHGDDQRGALLHLFKDVGFVSAIIARELGDRSLEIIDGHLRSDMAGDQLLPVLVVDLDDAEAAKVLATFDPISAMADTDFVMLEALFRDIPTEFFDENAHMRQIAADIEQQLAREERADAKEDGKEIPGMALTPHEHYDYLVVLATTTHEWNVLCDRLGLTPERRRGRMGTCRAMRAARLLDLLPATAAGNDESAAPKQPRPEQPPRGRRARNA